MKLATAYHTIASIIALLSIHVQADDTDIGFDKIQHSSFRIHGSATCLTKWDGWLKLTKCRRNSEYQNWEYHYGDNTDHYGNIQWNRDNYCISTNECPDQDCHWMWAATDHCDRDGDFHTYEQTFGLIPAEGGYHMIANLRDGCCLEKDPHSRWVRFNCKYCDGTNKDMLWKMPEWQEHYPFYIHH